MFSTNFSTCALISSWICALFKILGKFTLKFSMCVFPVIFLAQHTRMYLYKINFNQEDVLEPYKSLNYSKLLIIALQNKQKSFKQNST